MSNPVLVELTRGPLVESMHTGAFAVAGPTGDVLLSVGDVTRPVYPRSAIKPLQALALLETGAADRWQLEDADIAIACASHSGSARHTERVRAMLARAGLAPAALGCGAHPPGDEQAGRQLILTGTRPDQLHNNCSGKHAGMLLTAAHLGEPMADYWQVEHPVQKRIRTILEGLCARGLGPEVTGIDGCSVPNWAVPVADLARAFAAFATGEGPGAAHFASAQRIMKACWAAPDMVGGDGRLDTEVMRRLPNEVVLKTGAEGVYAAALPQAGLGIALKIDDGARRAAEALVLAIMAHIVPKARHLVPSATIRNVRGFEVGETRITPAVQVALEGLRV
jgi:L-asparaginase II